MKSKSKTTAYHGRELKGAPITTIVRGRFVIKDGKFR